MAVLSKVAEAEWICSWGFQVNPEILKVSDDLKIVVGRTKSKEI